MNWFSLFILNGNFIWIVTLTIYQYLQTVCKYSVFHYFFSHQVLYDNPVRHWSSRKVIFSVVSVCVSVILFTWGESLHRTLIPLYSSLAQGSPFTWPCPLPTQICSSLFKLDLIWVFPKYFHRICWVYWQNICNHSKRGLNLSPRVLETRMLPQCRKDIYVIDTKF